MSCLAISQFYNQAYCGLNCFTLKMSIEQLSIGHWSTVGFSSRILNQQCYSCFMLNSQSTSFIDIPIWGTVFKRFDNYSFIFLQWKNPIIACFLIAQIRSAFNSWIVLRNKNKPQFCCKSLVPCFLGYS